MIASPEVRPGPDSVWETLRAAETEHLLAVLDGGGAVTVSASEVDEALMVVQKALERRRDWTSAAVDVGLSATADRFAQALVAAVVTLVAGSNTFATPPEARTREQTKAVIEARRLLGPTFEAFENRELSRSPAAAAADSLEALADFGTSHDERVFLVLVSADALLRDHSFSDVLWSMRGTAQGLPNLRLIFCGGPATPRLTSDKDAAFFGWGTTIELRSPTPAALRAAAISRLVTVLPAEIVEQAAADVLRITDGSRSAVRELVELTLGLAAQRPYVGLEIIDEAWSRLVEMNGARLRLLANGLTHVHRFALPVVLALLETGRPYTAADDARSRTSVARALLALEAAGFTERIGGRRWRLVDPLLAAWLRLHNVPT